MSNYYTLLHHSLKYQLHNIVSYNIALCLQSYNIDTVGLPFIVSLTNLVKYIYNILIPLNIEGSHYLEKLTAD